MHKKHTDIIRIFLCGAMILGAAACSHVKKADYLPKQQEPADAHPSPVGFSHVELKLPTGYDAGGIASARQSFFCEWPYDSVGRGDVRDFISQKDLKEAFTDTLQAQGYDITGVSGFAFGEDFEEEELRSEYKVGAKITESDLFACYYEPDLLQWIFGLRRGADGEFYVGVEWYVFDLLRRTTVYKTRTEGYAKRSRPNQDGLTLLLNDAFAMAAHNLGADPAFHDLVFYGKKPPDDWRKRKPAEDRPRQFTTDEKVTIANPPLSATPFSTRADHDRKVAVLVQAGAGHGSGFFITKEGHILTNAHVVGDALRARIVTADKKEALIAEVLRKDYARDVALLKLEEVPEGLEIVTLPLRTAWPDISETVYSIGAPRMTRMQDTVRSGIISAHRKDFKLMGVKMDFLQADVVTQQGNSGGPLLDENGNLIAFSHAGMLATEARVDLSLNFFIPIESALEALGITLAEKPGNPVKLQKN